MSMSVKPLTMSTYKNGGHGTNHSTKAPEFTLRGSRLVGCAPIAPNPIEYTNKQPDQNNSPNPTPNS